MSYDTNTEVLSLLAKPDVRFEPGETDQAEPMRFQAGSAHARPPAAPAVARGAGHASSAREQTMAGDAVLARLSEDEQRVSLVELRGHSSVKGEGSLESMTARDMDLLYAEDGETLQRAVLTADAQVVRGAGAARRRPPLQRRRRWTWRSTRRARWSRRRDATAWWWTCRTARPKGSG